MHGWEGNRRSSLTLVMRQTWFIHIQDQRLRKEDEHPTYTPLRGTAHYLIQTKD